MPARFALASAAALGLAAAASAGSPPSPPIGWSYYGLGGGGPYVTTPPETKPGHKQPYAVYGPHPTPDPVCGHHWVKPRHPGFGTGWFGYFTPSPRPKPPTVGIQPPANPTP